MEPLNSDRESCERLQVLAVPPNVTLLHITHWKAGSQWMRGMLEEAFGPHTIGPKNFEKQLLIDPIQQGKVYTCAYISRQELAAVQLPRDTRRFIMIRDLRDTLVSGYFSIRFTHGANDWIEKWRLVIDKLSVPEGMEYLMEVWLNNSALVQRSWLESGEPCFRLEDFMRDPAVQMERMLRENWRLPVAHGWVESLATRHAFSNYAGGRAPGVEDRTSHYRKGVRGDWREHFTEPLKRRFKGLYNDLLVLGGYEKDGSW